MDELRKEIIDRTHTWIRDCGLDVQDVEAFVDRELVQLIKQDRLQTRIEEVAVLHDSSLGHSPDGETYVGRRYDILEAEISQLTTNSEADQ